MIEVNSASRLHFGLLSFGGKTVRDFGGVGAMIRKPALRVRVCPAEGFRATGREKERVHQIARRWASSTGHRVLPDCEIQVLAAPRHHVGLGLGTQLGLTVGTALSAYMGSPQPPVEQLARDVGRGLRSAVGTYGFAQGGLLFEPGKLPSEPISPLERRVALPTAWRFVLVCPHHRRGLHGGSERHAFSRLPPVSQEVADRLAYQVRERLFPAAERADFEAFGESVRDYGYQAGLCFSEVQGGAYNGPEAEQLVQILEKLGVRGVGQSSWGPTIFGICSCQESAERLVDQLRHRLEPSVDLCISPPCNEGATVLAKSARREERPRI